MEPTAAFCLLIFALVPLGCQSTEWDGFTPWFTGSGEYIVKHEQLVLFLYVYIYSCLAKSRIFQKPLFFDRDDFRKRPSLCSVAVRLRRKNGDALEIRRRGRQRSSGQKKPPKSDSKTFLKSYITIPSARFRTHDAS